MRASACSHCLRRAAHHDEVVRVAHQRPQRGAVARPQRRRARAGRCSTASGEITPPCGVPATVRDDDAVLHHTCLEPLPQQLEHPPVRDAPSHQLHQLVVVDAPEVVADVGVEHVMAALGAELPQRLQRHRRAPLRPEAVRARQESPPRRSAPAPASPPSAPPGPGPSGCPAAASFHRPSGCTGAGPPPAGTRLRAARRRALPGSARRRTARRRRSSGHRRPPRPCSASPASTPPTGRHSCGCGRTARGSAFPVTAWPRPTVAVAVVALCRAAYGRRGR